MGRRSDTSRYSRRSLLRTLAMLLAALLVFTAIGRSGTPSRPSLARTGAASGSLEGEVRLRKRTAARTAERYVSASGEPREVQDIPAVVYIEGRVGSAPPARASGPMEIVQQGETFRPVILVVPVGATVTFPNADSLFHNVFSYSRARRFDLGRYPKGESKTVIFDKPGYVKVMCEVHKWMRAAIVVVENPYYAILPSSGHFRFDDLPAGRYRLTVEDFERRSQVDVSIPESGAAKITISL